MSSREPSNGTVDPVAIGADLSTTRASIGIELQERERRRIGFDLHDGPAQTMSAALLQVRMLQDLDHEALRQGLEELRSTLAIALDEIYELIENLGGRDPDTEDLTGKIRSCVRTFSDRYRMVVDLDVEGSCGEISRSLEIAVSRIVQEALCNAGKHSGASRVRVLLRLSPREVRCEVSDDGRGFSPREARVSHRGREAFGLCSMSERARLLDGACTVESIPGEGTRVIARIPVWRG
jgi:two-component system sensor histidine kinase DegS